MESSPFNGFDIPFSYSNTCALMGSEVFGACNSGERLSKCTMIEQLPTPAGTLQSHPTKTVTKAEKIPKSQFKPHFFVNHDAKHLKPQATRSEITSHLRTAYQPWKHRMQARARRGSSKSCNDQNCSKSFSGCDPIQVLERLVPKSNKSASEEDWLDFSLVETNVPNRRTEIQDVELSRSPSPPFYRGNSDPFSALSFDITPLIAELIKFEHAHLHPGIYNNNNTPSRAFGTTYLADMHGHAANQAAVYGYLSRAAIVLSSVSLDPRFALAALELKGTSSNLLRNQLASGEGANPGDVMRKILALMIAELFAHNYEAALTHSKILIRLLKQESEKEDFDIHFFFSVIYSEMQRSCMSLRNPCFDVSPHGWVAQMFESVGGDAFRTLVTQLDIAATPFEVCVLGKELAEIFGEVRTVRLMSQTYSTSPLYGTLTPLALYLPARVVLYLGKLVIYYLDHSQGRPLASLSSRDLIHHSAVLGALYWVRKAGNIDSIKVGVNTIYSAGPMILTRLRAALARFDDSAPLAEKELYKELRFWVLYIGAQEEQERAGCGEAVDKWFTRRLITASAEINVHTWQQARPILERYPHPEVAEPHGSTWFSSIFSDVSTSSTCLGGVFARTGSTRFPNPKLRSTAYGTGEYYRTWTTEMLFSSIVDRDLTCAIAAEDTWPTC